MSEIKLSICIPAYNRAAYIGVLLDSLLPQMKPGVEIVVCDNASTDGTGDVIRAYQEYSAAIHYFRNEVNLGADRNYLRVVECARGEYCWLIGSDDVAMDDSVEFILSRLDGADILLGDRINMSSDMKLVLDTGEKFHRAVPNSVYDCNNHAALLRYFRDCNGIGGMFSYLSVIVVQRSEWLDQHPNADLIGSAWIHVNMLFQMMADGARVMYLGRPIVLNRTGNDSFLTDGYTRRVLLDFDYARVARLSFPEDSAAVDAVLSVLANEIFTFRSILARKCRSRVSEGVDAVAILRAGYVKAFEPVRWFRVKMLFFTLMPTWILRFPCRLLLERREGR